MTIFLNASRVQLLPVGDLAGKHVLQLLLAQAAYRIARADDNRDTVVGDRSVDESQALLLGLQVARRSPDVGSTCRDGLDTRRGTEARDKDAGLRVQRVESVSCFLGDREDGRRAAHIESLRVASSTATAQQKT
jgi:hypothetical protein